MKSRAVIGSVLICVAAVHAANSDSDRNPDCYDSKSAMSWVDVFGEAPGGISFQEKTINRSGDRVALGIVNAFTLTEMFEPSRLKHILSVVRVAFDEPSLITRDQDRRPAVTMLLLSYLEHEPSGAGLRQSILETEKYICTQTKYRGSPCRGK